MTEQSHRRFLQLALALTAGLFVYKLFVIFTGRLEIGVDGDEGVRIFRATLMSQSWRDIGTYLVTAWDAIHPPGDIALRAVALNLIRAVDADINPVYAAMFLSAVSGTIGATFLVLAAHRISGGIGALFTAAMLAISWKFHNPSLSGIGEGTIIGFFGAQVYLLVDAVHSNSRQKLIASAVLGLLASFVRPEPIFFLPGLCLALWYVIGFRLSFVYGLIAASYIVLKTIVPLLFKPDAVTIFNFSERYAFKGVSLYKFFGVPYGTSLLNDPFPLSFVVLLALAIYGLYRTRTTLQLRMRTDLAAGANFVLLAGTLAYLLVTIYSVTSGKTANASARLGYLPAYTLFISSGYGFAQLVAGRAWPIASRYAAGTGVVIALLAGVWGAAVISTKAPARAPVDAIPIKNWLLANVGPDDGILFDRTWNRENWLVAYVANYKKVCAYFYCAVESSATTDTFIAPANCGAHGLACLYVRIHKFVASDKPKWLVTHSGQLSARWLNSQKSLFGNDGVKLWSFVHPYSEDYSAGTRDYKKPLAKVRLVSGSEITLTPAYRSSDIYVYKIAY